MKHQALFSSKDKSKKLKCCLLQFLFGALRVKWYLLLFLVCLSLQYKFQARRKEEPLLQDAAKGMEIFIIRVC